MESTWGNETGWLVGRRTDQGALDAIPLYIPYSSLIHTELREPEHDPV